MRSKRKRKANLKELAKEFKSESTVKMAQKSVRQWLEKRKPSIGEIKLVLKRMEAGSPFVAAIIGV